MLIDGGRPCASTVSRSMGCHIRRYQHLHAALPNTEWPSGLLVDSVAVGIAKAGTAVRTQQGLVNLKPSRMDLGVAWDNLIDGRVSRALDVPRSMPLSHCLCESSFRIRYSLLAD
jgi:hypothetical protein